MALSLFILHGSRLCLRMIYGSPRDGVFKCGHFRYMVQAVSPGYCAGRTSVAVNHVLSMGLWNDVSGWSPRSRSFRFHSSLTGKPSFPLPSPYKEGLRERGRGSKAKTSTHTPNNAAFRYSFNPPAKIGKHTNDRSREAYGSSPGRPRGAVDSRRILETGRGAISSAAAVSRRSVRVAASAARIILNKTRRSLGCALDNTHARLTDAATRAKMAESIGEVAEKIRNEGCVEG